MVALVFKKESIVISMIFFIILCFYQYGYSYHVSMGSIGLILLIAKSRNNITGTSLRLSILIPAFIMICFSFHVAKYGDSDYFVKILRYCFNAWALYLLLNSTYKLKPPPENILLLFISILLFIAFYQNFFDNYARAPNFLMAIPSEFLETERLRELMGGEVLKDELRAWGLYTEPSALALVSCCILIINLNSATRYKNLITVLVVCVVILSGSLLGYIGSSIILLLIYKKEIIKNKKALIAFTILLPISIVVLVSLMIQRSSGTGYFLDPSTMIRLVYPFFVIVENFNNYDFLGYSGDIYSHFLYLGIYDSLGDYPGHNGILYLIQSFGILGLAMVYLLYKNLNSILEYFIIFLIGSQSGNFFSYEKVYLMVYMIFIYRYCVTNRLHKVEPKLKMDSL